MSMTSAELVEVSRQLSAIAGHARILIAECDVEVTRVYPFTGAIAEVEGRGGTDLRPVFAPEFLGAHRPDGVVYFTDGEGPFPDEPPRVATLWILTKPKDFGCPWGERASMVRKAPAKPAPKKRGARASA
jgi:predicted metal-dependent peptidase